MTRRRGRPYQPYPERRNRTYLAVVILVGIALVIGFTIFGSMR